MRTKNVGRFALPGEPSRPSIVMIDGRKTYQRHPLLGGVPKIALDPYVEIVDAPADDAPLELPMAV